MFEHWRGLVNARQLEDAQKYVEDFVAAQCLALHQQAVRAASEGGATASCKRRKLACT